MHPLVTRIEELFLPELQRLASEMQQLHPALQFNVWHDSAGSLTDYQGYALGVECAFPRVAPNVSDVAFSVDLCHLTSTPKLMADVAWGHPSGHSEAAFREGWRSSNEWPEATEEVVEELRKQFPNLVRAFQSAVERGAPPTMPDGIDYSGMTVNERLSSVGIMPAWDVAAKSRNRKHMVELLGRVGLADHADQIVDTVLSNPKRYGF
jgi:hypothetical protein